jgi:hypothetical protein
MAKIVKKTKTTEKKKVNKEKPEKKAKKVAKRAPPPHDATPIKSNSELVALIGVRKINGKKRFHAAKFNAKDAKFLEKAAKKAEGVKFKIVEPSKKTSKIIESLPEGKLWKEKGGIFAPFTSTDKYEALSG